VHRVVTEEGDAPAAAVPADPPAAADAPPAATQSQEATS